MTRLRTDPALGDPDAILAELVELHRGLTTEQSLRLNARLILLLANHIGDDAVLREAMEEARRGI